MLNRIYIIVGMLAIIVIAGAFIAPRFIQWSDYRGRMEELATGVLGTQVTIRGDIDFSLLPQPRLSFTNVLVGSTEEPAATVEAVVAEFSLMDFLRDNYTITRLVLRGPVVDFTVDESGFFGSGVALVASDGGVGLGQTSVEDGTIRLLDRRTGQTFAAGDIDGDLRLGSTGGPFSFTGAAQYGGERYAVRFNASALDATGNARVATAIRSESGAFSFSSEGLLTPGIAPKYDGTLVYRQSPPPGASAEDIRGDLIFESKVTASTDRIVLSSYVLQPDENRAGTRLTGAASIQLGARNSFDAVISGGVFALPPRDADEDASSQPYELVRLLSELPAPLLPPLPGRIGVDLAEVGLRGFALRNVRLDASSDGATWTLETFVAQLPGDTELRAQGTLTAEGDRPNFRGSFSVKAARLDGLGALWRKPSADNPLFNQPARLEGRMMLGADALGINGGALTLAGMTHELDLRIGFAGEKRLDLVAHFGALGEAGSAIVAALLPDAGAPQYGISFPEGSFSLTAESGTAFGLSGTGLVAEGQWTPNAIRLSRLAAERWGGVGFDIAAEIGASEGRPWVSGAGAVSVPVADAPALARLYDLQALPAAWRDAIGRSIPAELDVELSPPESNAQVLTLNGIAGAGTLDLRAELGGGLLALADSPLRLAATLESSDATALTAQLGLGDAAIFAGSDMMAHASLEGTPGNSLAARLALSSGEESLSFSGDLYAAGQELRGDGSLDLSLADAGVIAGIVGASGLSLPAAEARADLHFEGNRLARLTNISGASGEDGFTGEVSLSRTGTSAAIAGALELDSVSVEGMAALLFGPAALVPGEGPWPEGPFDMGAVPRTTRGSVSVSAAAVTAGGAERLTNATFDFTWDDTRQRIARFDAASGEGALQADVTICCAGALAEKTLSGRISLEGVAVDDVAPPALAEALAGTVDGGASFEATGASLADAFSRMAGEGSFAIADLAITRLGPAVYSTVSGLEGVLDMEPDALSALMGLALEQGTFSAPEAHGTFTIAGGTVRLNNLIIDGNGARLAGSLAVNASTLGLTGDFTMTPRDFNDPSGLVAEDTARVVARLDGTLTQPDVSLNTAEMVAAVQVRAGELEVERLEILRQQDEERQRVAAEERNRLIEEQRKRAAVEATIRAAEDAARLAAEAEAARLQQEQLLLQSPSIQVLPNSGTQTPLDLGLPPVNQPIGPGVNQPFGPVN